MRLSVGHRYFSPEVCSSFPKFVQFEAPKSSEKCLLKQRLCKGFKVPKPKSSQVPKFLDPRWCSWQVLTSSTLCVEDNMFLGSRVLGLGLFHVVSWLGCFFGRFLLQKFCGNGNVLLRKAKREWAGEVKKMERQVSSSLSTTCRWFFLPGWALKFSSAKTSFGLTSPDFLKSFSDVQRAIQSTGNLMGDAPRPEVALQVPGIHQAMHYFSRWDCPMHKFCNRNMPLLRTMRALFPSKQTMRRHWPCQCDGLEMWRQKKYVTMPPFTLFFKSRGSCYDLCQWHCITGRCCRPDWECNLCDFLKPTFWQSRKDDHKEKIPMHPKGQKVSN